MFNENSTQQDFSIKEKGFPRASATRVVVSKINPELFLDGNYKKPMRDFLGRINGVNSKSIRFGKKSGDISFLTTNPDILTEVVGQFIEDAKVSFPEPDDPWGALKSTPKLPQRNIKR